MTNTAYDMLRRSKQHPTQTQFSEDKYNDDMESLARLADSSASVQDRVEQNEFAKGLYQLLDELAHVYRIVLTLIDMCELDYAEAADVLKVPLGTVKSRLARGRLQMIENCVVKKYAILPILPSVRNVVGNRVGIEKLCIFMATDEHDIGF